MNAEYLRYCLGILTDSQFVLYSALKTLAPGQLFTLSEMAEMMGRSPDYPDRLRSHFRNLEKKKFIIYRAIPGEGHEVLWIRQRADEKAPDARTYKREAAKYVVRHPQHGRKTLTHGNIRQFVERNGLNYRAFRAVLSGDRNHHHNWSLSD